MFHPKESVQMKKNISYKLSGIAVMLFSGFSLFCQTVTVDGNIFLQGETTHENITVAFKRIAPTTLYDTAYTNNSGYFSKTISPGAWDISYHKNGFLSKYFHTQAIYGNYTMKDTIMEVAICGSIKGTLKAGTYIVTSDLLVNSKDTLVIEAGVSLLFSKYAGITIQGLLIARGEENNRILFSWYNKNERWNGMNINHANKSSILKYCTFEYSLNRGLTIESTNLSVDNIIVSNNAMGGIWINSCDPHLTNIKVSFNSTSSPVYGGGIMMRNSSSHIENFIINNNSSTNWGGAISVETYGPSIYPVFSNGLIYRNTAPGGGADNEYVDNGYLTYKNCLFYDNKAYSSSYSNCFYIQSHSNHTRFENCIFQNNQKVFMVTNPEAQPLIFNSIFWGNLSNFYNISDPWMGKLVTVNANGDPTDAYGNLFINPNLKDPANNDFHPSNLSPCINAGPIDTTDMDLPDTDIEGKQRIFGEIVDIGPYEYTGCTVVANTITTNVSCNGLNNGRAIAKISGGILPLAYQWSTGENSDTISSLSPGNYQLKVTDAAGCTSIDHFSISEPDPIGIGLQVFGASCGGSNGSAVAFPTGGTKPYSYQWDGNKGGFALTGVPVGNYSLLVNDKNGCRTDSVFYLPGPDSLKVDVHKRDMTCYQSGDGIIALHPYGGVAPFIFQWSHGSNSDSINNLGQGVYNYIVTDVNECFTTGSVYIKEPVEIKLALDMTDATCGTNDGKATVFAYQGGIVPFSYIWSNGDTLATADSMRAGSYSVTLTDAHGCLGSKSFNIKDINSPEIVFTSVKHVSCFGLTDGAIGVSVKNGLEPYSFLWSTDSASDSISGLSAGNYTLTVSDLNNCSNVQSVQITQPEKLGAFLSVENTQCGLSQGVISANVIGGTKPYSYKWSDGSTNAIAFDLSSGIYHLVVTDENNCLLTKSETVRDVNGPSLSVDLTIPATCNNNDGHASLLVTGGIPPYSFTWSNGAVTTNAYNDTLRTGQYYVTVKDNAGCDNTAPVMISNSRPTAPSITMVTVDSISGMNKVIWKNSRNMGIEKYRIFKERYIAGYFELAGESSTEEYSEYVDEFADPRQRSWKYKISAVDECGSESDLSIYHETIHLTINASVNKDVNLIWNNYGGYNFSTYYIHRYAKNTGWELIDSIPAGLYENKYTDFSPPPAHLTYYISYKIPVDNYNMLKEKSTHETALESISNFRENDVAVGTDDAIIENTDLTVYPNPFNDKINLNINFIRNEKIRIRILNSLGKLMADYSEIQCHGGINKIEIPIDVEVGFYFMEIYIGDKVYTKKVLKQN